MLARTGMTPLLELNDFKAHVALLDGSGTIIAVNDTWREFADANRLQDYVGWSYFKLWPKQPAVDAFRQDLRDLISGEIDLLASVSPCQVADRIVYWGVIGFRIADDQSRRTALLHIELSDLLPLLLSDRGIRWAAGISAVANSGLSMSFAAQAVWRSNDEHTAVAPARRHRDTSSELPDTAPSAEAQRLESRISRLSRRECQVLAAIAEGKSNAEIACGLGLSPNTIKIHVSEILTRLNISSRTQAALLACKVPDILHLAQGRRRTPHKRRRHPG